MHDFTPEQLRRWEVWQQAGAVSMQRSARLARLFGFAMIAAAAGAVVVTIWIGR